MRAILTRYNSDQKPIASLGNDPENRRLTKEYKSFAMLYRYAIRPALKQWDGRLKAEIWDNDNIYTESDRVLTWNTHIYSNKEN